MTESDFVHERGDPIDVGSPVENDFVHERGELVSDHDQSELAHIRGRGLGGIDAILHFGYWHEDANIWPDFHAHLESTFGFEVDFFPSDTHDFDEVVDSSYGLVIVSMETTSFDIHPTSAELSAFSDYWDNVGRATVMTDDISSRRMEAANDYIEAAIGTRPFNEDDTGEGDACRTGDQVPTDEHPIFEGVEYIGRRGSEALMTDGSVASPVNIIPGAEARPSFGYYDGPDGRLYVNGAEYSFDDNWTPYFEDCADNARYATQMIEWLRGER